MSGSGINKFFTFRRFVIGALVLVILIVGLVLAAPFLLIVSEPLPQTDAIIVLAGSREFLVRNQKAAELYNAKVSDHIILTNDGIQGGWNNELKRNPYFVEKAQWELERDGVAPSSIEILEPTISGGTRDEARFVIDSIKDRNYRSVLLVTSPFHTRRALISYQTAVTNAGVKLDIGIVPANQKDHWQFSPSAWIEIGKEYIKNFYYFS